MTTTCALTSQVQLGVLSVFSIVLPPSYESFLLRLSLWEVQLPFNCMFPFTFASKLLMKTLGPFFVFLVLFLLASIAKLYSNLELRERFMLCQPSDRKKRAKRMDAISTFTLMISIPMPLFALPAAMLLRREAAKVLRPKRHSVATSFHGLYRAYRESQRPKPQDSDAGTGVSTPSHVKDKKIKSPPRHNSKMSSHGVAKGPEIKSFGGFVLAVRAHASDCIRDILEMVAIHFLQTCTRGRAESSTGLSSRLRVCLFVYRAAYSAACALAATAFVFWFKERSKCDVYDYDCLYRRYGSIYQTPTDSDLRSVRGFNYDKRCPLDMPCPAPQSSLSLPLNCGQTLPHMCGAL